MAKSVRNDQLQQDLAAAQVLGENILQTLIEHHVTTYSGLFAIIRDPATNPELRVNACWTASRLSKIIDNRTAIPAVMIALDSPVDKVRSAAAYVLGLLGSRKAVLPLIDIVGDKRQTPQLRVDAAYGLGMIGDSRAMPVFKRIIYDQADDLDVRSTVLEQSTYLQDTEFFADYVQMLADPSPDMRFWAAYGLMSSGWSVDLASIVHQLDQIVAYDHTLPLYWGWHVDREAMAVLEIIYYAPYRTVLLGEDGDPYSDVSQTYLISPAPEYFTLAQEYRHWTDSWIYVDDPLPPITLKIDPAWLAEKLQANWPDVVLNQRQPRPQAYMLDWVITIDGQTLIGALHRDQYAVVITAKEAAMSVFAAWYRGIIDAAQPLFLYEWAGPGKELRPGMTPDQVAALPQMSLLNSTLNSRK